MHKVCVEKVLDTIKYQENGLPAKGDPSVPWVLEKLDPSAIASRTLVKSFGVISKGLVDNIQRHEAKRGRLFPNIYEKMLNNHDLSLRGQRVLEVGAGPGAVCLGLQEMGAKVVSLDMWDGRIFYDEEIPFLVASGTALPFTDKSFDLLSLTSVLHHLPVEYRETILKEAFRVANLVLIQEDCLASNPVTNAAMRLVDDGVSGEIGTHQAESHMTKQGWLEYFKEMGLKVLDSEDYHPKWLGVGIQKTFFVVTKNENQN
ncbi:MAG: methyltransferase domain-containing protein [Patescibacteria group bacterium]